MCAERVAWGQSLFCDDVRYEVGGKKSLIGIYMQELVVRELPALLPKLCIYVIYQEEKDALKDDLSMQIFMPSDDDRPFLNFDIPRASALPAPSLTVGKDTEVVLRIEAPIEIAPLELKDAGAIKVRMVCGSVVTKLGRLNVRASREDEAHMFSAPIPAPAP